MRNFSINLLIIIFLAACQEKDSSQASLTSPALAPSYPAVDTIFGQVVNDPYLNLEDLKDPEVLKWLQEQSAYSEDIIKNISGRDRLLKKMKEFDERQSATVGGITITPNDHYFYLKRMVNDQTGKLFHRLGFEGKEKLLFDPEQYGVDSLNYSISVVFVLVNK